MSSTINPVQEHYLKKQLIKLQLAHELNELNSVDALRRFGHPFANVDPKTIAKKKSSNVFATTLMLSSSSSKNNKNNSVNSNSVTTKETAFPLLNSFLRIFIIPFPLFSKDVINDSKFWQQKLQVFYEHFMTLNFSDSEEREKLTKRKKISEKSNKLMYLLFDAHINTINELAYFSTAKDAFLTEKDAHKRSKLENFGIPSQDTIQYLVTDEPVYINGWDINVIGILDSKNTIEIKTKKERVVSTSSTSSTKSSYSLGIPSTPKWMKNAITTSTTTSSAFFSKLVSTETTGVTYKSKSSHYFLLKVIDNTKENERLIYLKKSYEDFQALNLALKADFPSKRLPKLPRKQKINGLNSPPPEMSALQDIPMSPSLSDVLSNYSLDKSIEEEGEEDKSVTEREGPESFSINNNLNCPRENTRTSLRQYLRGLCEDKDIAFSEIMFNFFKDSTEDVKLLGESTKEDIIKRRDQDIANLQNEIRNQFTNADHLAKLQDFTKTFKKKLLMDKSYLGKLVSEIRNLKGTADMSTDLMLFVECVRTFFASFIYHLLLGNKNSYGLYTQIKRLHKLMPYTMMSQIMKVTNPMSIMKGMTDLFLTQPFGGYSLIQTMFTTVLNEDLKAQNKIIKKLEKMILEEGPGSQALINCLKNFVANPEASSNLTIETIKEDSKAMEMPISLIILIRNAESGNIPQTIVDQVIESYMNWKIQHGSEGVITESEKAISLLFSNVKELLQLYYKEHDKKLMRKMWQDPELSQLLKAFVNVIYDPMVKVFKVANVAVALKLFEKFMNDLIKLINSNIHGELGVCTKFDIICSLNNLLLKHQEGYLKLAIDFCKDDTEGIVDEYVQWFENILEFLRNDEAEIKKDMVDIESLSREAATDIVTLKTEIDDIIDNKFDIRRIHKELILLRKKKMKIIIDNTGTTNIDILNDNSYSLADINNQLESLEKKYKELVEKDPSVVEIEKLRTLAFNDYVKDIFKM
ncbi:hypothetical protein Kpol_1025p25 [Vanderwaltozyma polyspora DSM 70294]|uniref:PX domain-containing protein n=1 Tax=Vanderwaltozyma polyspora (strain ATCC 22028 / DSM 70294 / BCRC 21397 / CBS 2163 / NBRC 10782 / NRRL Y-8283 / UCD 57-17) TaxID=436907 RepID=A7TKV0_VANPO|nr:uncharacterized protein Kpol_1025p25 [Vanderwaltozyma polyspora DSM 70294]EDO17105.1 hypothetical protein Kpol_1025p25 [Vanderwaltozyma polyspora DSM 70294]